MNESIELAKIINEVGKLGLNSYVVIVIAICIATYKFCNLGRIKKANEDIVNNAVVVIKNRSKSPQKIVNELESMRSIISKGIDIPLELLLPVNVVLFKAAHKIMVKNVGEYNVFWKDRIVEISNSIENEKDERGLSGYLSVAKCHIMNFLVVLIFIMVAFFLYILPELITGDLLLSSLIECSLVEMILLISVYYYLAGVILSFVTEKIITHFIIWHV